MPIAFCENLSKKEVEQASRLYCQKKERKRERNERELPAERKSGIQHCPFLMNSALAGLCLIHFSTIDGIRIVDHKENIYSDFTLRCANLILFGPGYISRYALTAKTQNPLNGGTS